VKAVPGLLELTDDPSLNATTRAWVYQALREITDEFLLLENRDRPDVLEQITGVPLVPEN